MRRPRLFAEIENALASGHLWVAAPAGSGKTSLASSYLDQAACRCLWYQIDAGDADPATFFYYLGISAKQALPIRKQKLPLLTPEFQADVHTFARRFFEQLYDRLKHPAILVFDNYHDLSPAALLHEIFGIAFETCPTGIRIVMLSRERPPKSLAGFATEGKMRIIEGEDIRLTRAEAKEMIGKHRRKNAAAGKLYSLTEGWVAGLSFLASRIERERAAELQDYAQIFDYFAHEVAGGLAPSTRDFLQKTAFLPVMTPSMASRLTGSATAGKILNELHSRNCFIEKIKTRKRAYRYHPLFRQYLLACAEENYTAQQRKDVIQDAADLLAEAGQVEDAAALYIQNGDGERVCDLVLAHAPALAAQGRFATLEVWLRAVPLAVQANEPWFAFWSGICHMFFSLAEARPLLKKAFYMFECAGDMAGMLTAWSAVVDSYIPELNDYTPLDFWIAWLDRRLHEGLAFPSAQIEARVAISMTGALIWRCPDRSDLAQWVESALCLSAKLPDESLKVQACVNAGIYYLWYDEQSKASFVMAELKRALRSSGGAPIWTLALKYFEAIMHLTFGRCGLAVNAARDGLAIARKTGVRLWETSLYGPAFYASLEIGDLASAAVFLTRTTAAGTEGRLNLAACCHHMSAWYHLIRGDRSLAAAHAESAVEKVIASGTPFPQIISHHIAVLTLRAVGEHAKANEHLQAAKALLSNIKSPQMNYILLLTEAEIAFEENRRAAGLRLLREALPIGRRQGNLTMLFQWRPEVLSRLCAEALACDIEVDYVKRLIAKFRLSPDDRARCTDRWPWPLKAYTLGRFGLEKMGTPMTFGAKIPRKPLDLLKALIALGGSGIDEHLVSDALWPNAEGDLGGRTLKTNLHRLRRLLGRDEAILINGGTISLHPELFWTDVCAFEAISDWADAAWASGDCAEGAELYAKAAGLYQGHFLAHEPAFWTLSTRERLKIRFVRSVSRRGAYLEECGSLEQALALYRAGIELDLLAEGFWMGLMRCFQRLGSRNDAVSAYHRFRKLLDAQLGISPSERMKKLYHQVAC